MRPHVPTLQHVDVAASAPDDHASRHCGGGFEGRVGVGLEGHPVAAPPALVLRYEQLALHIVHAAGQRLAAESAEDDRKRRPNARAREHRDRQLGDHPHIDPDVSTFLDAELLQGVGEAHDVLLELAKRDLAAILFRLALPEIGDLVLVT